MSLRWLENNWKIAIALAFIAVVAWTLLWQFWLAPTVFEQNREAGKEIAEDSMDSEKAVREYRWFRQQWFDIKSAREQLQNYKDQEEQFHETYGDYPQNWSRTTKNRHSRIHDRITGQRNQISQLVADYNARSSDATRAIFKCGLPYNVDEKLFIADATGVEYTSEEARNRRPPEDPQDCQFDSAPGEASNTTN
jgi:hypothetical protein